MNDPNAPDSGTSAETHTRSRGDVAWIAAFALAAALLSWAGIAWLGHRDVDVFDRWVPFLAIFLLAAGYAADRRGWLTGSKTVTALLVVTAVVAMHVKNDYRVDRLFDRHRIKAWNVFHYVLGTKYFDELGYFDLYKGAILADFDDGQCFKKVTWTRDLRTYKRIPKSKALHEAMTGGIRERFTDERWEDFQRDLKAIQRNRSCKHWGGPLTDLGFNPSPAWLIVHKPLLNALDISKRSTLIALCCMDLVFFAGMIALCWWGFGLRVTAVATLWMNLYFGNWNLLVGSYFHYDWLFFTVAAVVLHKKNRMALAAIALAYAAMMRGFPGLLALHPALVWAKDAVRLRVPARRHTVFLFVLTGACLAQILLGAAVTSRGLPVWSEWREKISLHASRHPLYSQRIGLIKFATHDYRTGNWRMPREKRAEIIRRNTPHLRIAQAAFVALTLAAMLRRKDHDGILLGMVPAFALLTLSRYYASTWLLLFTWTAMDRRRIGNLLSDAAMFAFLALYYWMDAREELSTWTVYYVFNAAMATYFAVVVLQFLIRDAAALVRRGKGGAVNPPRVPA